MTKYRIAQISILIKRVGVVGHEGKFPVPPFRNRIAITFVLFKTDWQREIIGRIQRTNKQVLFWLLY